MPNNLISLDVAKKMTALYRRERENVLGLPYKEKKILAVCETFDRQAFDTLLSEEGCTAVRIYYGMSDDLLIHAIAVGVNSNNEDILPAPEASVASGTDAVIIEESIRCPDKCPPESPLNS